MAPQATVYARTLLPREIRNGHLPNTKEVHRALWNRVQIEFPDQRYVTLTHPKNILEVWDHSGNLTDREAFVERCDTKEFADSLASE
jgi:hypothetical protein